MAVVTYRFYDHHLDVTQHEIRNMAEENLAAAPATPVKGQRYFDTALGYSRQWDGTKWLDSKPAVGLYIGSAATFAALPTSGAKSGDFAVLTADDVGTGTALSPQYPKGVYGYNGTAYALVASFGGAAVGDFVGATAVADGSAGLVPKPLAGVEEWYLRGSGTFSPVVGVYRGSAATFAALPTGASAKDTAILTAQDGANAPGIYVYNGAAWVATAPIQAPLADFTGATGVAAGTAGKVPAPAAGKQNAYLKGDGTFSDVVGTFTGSAATYATLPATTVTGNFAVLTSDDIGTGTALAPQYPKGIYRFDGTNYVNAGTFGGAAVGNFTGATGVAAGAAGLVPAPAAGQQNSYLKGDGTFSAVTGVYKGDAATFAALPTGASTGDIALLTAQDGANAPGIYAWDGSAWVNKAAIQSPLSDFTGATGVANGAHGLVPAPLAGEQNAFLGANGSWSGVPGRYRGEAATYAGLPATSGLELGDIAILSANDIGTGTAAAPQYPTGIYKNVAGTWTLVRSVLPWAEIKTDLSALPAPTDAQLVSAKAAKDYADNILKVNDAMVLKGAIDASTNPNYPTADAGDVYKISVAGKIGGASGVDVLPGDTIYCTVDSTAAGDQATAGSKWVVIRNPVTTYASILEAYTQTDTTKTVASNAMAAYVRKRRFQAGDGSATSFVLNHAMNTTSVDVMVYDVTNKTMRQPGIDVTDANNVTIGGFTVAPTANQLLVTVLDLNKGLTTDA